MENPFKVGDKVYKNFSFDGTPKQGYPNKKIVYTIAKIEDHDPVDGPVDNNAVCWLRAIDKNGRILSGGIWSFWQHLTGA